MRPVYLVVMARDFLKIPNLVTLSRLLFLIPTACFLSQPGTNNRIYALACLTSAAVSDFLDGFLARRLNQRTRLGLILDPVVDKIMAAILAVLLIIYRDFPFWLAATIIGRDLLIAVGGLAIKSKVSDVPPSNLTGKYSFASIAVLMCSYVIEFQFGIWLFTYITVAFIILSIILYARRFILIMRNRAVREFRDKLLYRVIRITVVWIISLYFLYRLGQYVGWI